MDNVETLTQAIIDGDSIEIERAFDQALKEKISDRLDNMRVQVAKSMFNEE